MAQLRPKQIKLAAAGDLLIGGTSGNGTTLSLGGSGTVLATDGSVLSWVTPTVATSSIVLSQGKILVGDSGGHASELSPGSVGNVVTSDGTNFIAGPLDASHVTFTSAATTPIVAGHVGGALDEVANRINAISGAFEYKGTLDASTNTLPASPRAGDFYKITVAGDFGGVGPTVKVSDAIVWDGTVWDVLAHVDSTVLGTTNRIAVTGTVDTGFTVDIDAAYVGQASITTLGTIGSGTWNGTAIDAAHGGTGQTTYAVGDILYASGTTALSALTIGGAHTVLHGGTTPSYSAVDLTADVTGLLPVANGGTGVASLSSLASALQSSLNINSLGGTPLTVANGGTGAITLTSNGVLLGNGTSAVTSLAAAADSTVLVGSAASAPQFLTIGLGFLDDVALSSPSTGQVLKYNGTKFANASITYSDLAGTPTSIEEDFDVVASGASTGQINAGVNASITLAHTPITGTVNVYFNGLKLRSNGFTVATTTVTLVDTVVGYSADTGDILEVRYSY